MMHHNPPRHTSTDGATRVTIHRQTVADRFTTIPNAVLRDRRLSARARGVLVYLLSLRDGWQTTARRLADEFQEGRDAIQTALRELETVGYLRRDRYRDAGNTWRCSWTVTDDPAAFNDETLPLPVENSADSAPVFPQVTGSPETKPQVRARTGYQARVSRPGKPGDLRKTSEVPSGGEARGAVVDNPGPVMVAAPPSNDNDQEEPPLEGPWCGRHPGGTETPCRPCGAARARYEAQEDRAARERARRAQEVSQARKSAFLGEIRDVCDHGTPAGDQPNPLTGRPWCPMCRAEA